MLKFNMYSLSILNNQLIPIKNPNSRRVRVLPVYNHVETIITKLTINLLNDIPTD
jgi:hypothetical protein